MTDRVMCDFIAQEWNKISPKKLTGEEILQFDKIRRFPSIYIPILYNGAKENLKQFLHQDETCAIIFLEGLR
jgi:hypothetical protein